MRVPSPNGLTDTVFASLTHIGPAVGSFPNTVKIPPVSTSMNFRWDGLTPGRDTVLAQATNFVPDTATLLVTEPWLFIRDLPASAVVDDTLFMTVYSTDSLAGTGSNPSSFTIHPVIDTLPITVTSTDSMAIAVDSTSTWRIPADRSSVSVRLIVRGPTQAQGVRILVDAPNTIYKPDTSNVVVTTAPAITLSPQSRTLGTGQQYPFYRAQIPNGVVDTTRVALAVSDTSVAGFSSDTVLINPGRTFSSNFTVFAKDTVASVQMTGTAPGFTQGTSVLIVNNPQLEVSTTNTGFVGEGSKSFVVYTEDETGSVNEVRDPLTVTLASTNQSVLTLDSTTVTAPGGSSFANATWTPVGVGTAQIIASAPGYKSDTSQVISVQTPQPILQIPPTLGVGQQGAGSVSLPFIVPATDTVVVTLSNSAPSVLTTPDTLTFLPFQSFRSFTPVGVSLGQAVVQATAPSFDASAPDTTVVGTPTLLIQSGTSGTVGGSLSMSVRTRDQAGVIHPVDQALTVTLTVDNPAVADFGGQPSVLLTVNVGSSSSSGNAILNLKSAGNVTVTATATGYVNGVTTITISP